jgi:2-keto-4-pentenoate hydratase/2-oxohepta-3-ene-1,7-dioic acid hydratase in catechol pathway
MKLVTFSPRDREETVPRIGGLLEKETIVDLCGAAALFLKEVEKEKKPHAAASRLIPADMGGFLERGEEAIHLARRTLVFISSRQKKERGQAVRGLRRESLIHPLAGVRLKAPVPRPGKIIALGLNFYDHAMENKVPPPEFPMGFLKASSTLIGHEGPIPYPCSTQMLDYEVEMAVVIGKRGKDIPREKAYDYVAGYTILNDITARDVQRREQSKRILLLGKNFDAFGPMGPYLVTKDEIPDPHQLEMELRVNREPEPRQKSSTGEMVFKVPDLIAYWSQMTLEPGDIISSGTPGGVAFYRQPDPLPWFLKPGDVVEAKIQGLGVLRNSII